MMRLVFFSCLLSTALAGVLPQGLDGRIVGGTSTTIDKYPYQISLELLGNHNCGGSIISSDYVLTAAHCLHSPPSSYKIRAGSTNRGSGGRVFSVNRMVLHPKYEYTSVDYDFALIQIAGTFDINANQIPIALPEQGEPVATGTSAVCTGWGVTDEETLASILKEVSVPIVDQAACNAAYYGTITARMMCAGVPEGGRDSCQSDSGGPLVAHKKLIGVVSWGAGCGEPNYPGVYARVASVRNWIKENSGV